ncbi:MAG: flagellar hook-basal body complex protein [Rickettsia sp.]|nr:flagellar hook-basal body complex protein [Rickettsia sp.]
MSFNSFSIAASGLNALQHELEITANNLSNAHSIGYKKDIVNTSDSFYKNLQSSAIQENEEFSLRPAGIKIGTGTKITSVTKNFSVGENKQTGRKLDVFLSNSGFISVNLPNGQRGYTRNGSFYRDNNTGRLIDFKGRVISSEITIPESYQIEHIFITEDGKFQYKNPTDNTIEDLGNLELFTFNNLDGLEESGEGIFLATESSGEEIAIDSNLYKIRQQYLEISNVDVFKELIALMRIQRLYEMNTRILKVSDEIAKETNNIKT